MSESIFNGLAGAGSSGQCLVSVGSHTMKQDAPVVVSDLRIRVRTVYPNLATDAIAHRGNTPLAEDDVVQPNEFITFMRKLGEKGIL